MYIGTKFPGKSCHPFFKKICFCTVLSVVCQKWNTSARWESPVGADYATTVFINTFFLSLFRVLLCAKFSTSLSRSFFSLKGPKIEWVWETDKQEGDPVHKFIKVTTSLNRSIFHVQNTSMLSPTLQLVITLPFEGMQPAGLLLCRISKGCSLLAMRGGSLWDTFICCKDRLYEDKVDAASSLALTDIPCSWASHSSKLILNLL